MCYDREIIRLIVKEECADKLDKIRRENREIERENKKIRTTLKLIKEQYDLSSDVEDVIDSILAI